MNVGLANLRQSPLSPRRDDLLGEHPLDLFRGACLQLPPSIMRDESRYDVLDKIIRRNRCGCFGGLFLLPGVDAARDLAEGTTGQLARGLKIDCGIGAKGELSRLARRAIANRPALFPGRLNKEIESRAMAVRDLAPRRSWLELI
jgi:hypothetical protein